MPCPGDGTSLASAALMSQLKVLVVYYSRSGNTRRIARAIADAIPSEVEEIIDDRDRRGIVAYLRSGFEAWFARPVPLRESRHDPRQFDVVLIGTPIWNSSVSSPVRSWLTRHRDQLPEVAFFVTYGGSGIQRVVRQLQELAARPPQAILALRERDLAAAAPKVAAFAAEIRRTVAPRQAA